MNIIMSVTILTRRRLQSGVTNYLCECLRAVAMMIHQVQNVEPLQAKI
jgi:hypothetical protein